MKTLLIILILLLSFTFPAFAGYADYGKDPPRPDYGVGKLQLGFIGGGVWDKGDHSRLGISSAGSSISAFTGYMIKPWLATEVYFSSGFTNSNTTEWEYAGYPEPAYYIGFSMYQVSGGIRARVSLAKDILWPYIGGGVVYGWGSREALTYDNLVMDSISTSGIGGYGRLGTDLYVLRSGWAAFTLDYRISYIPQKWEQLGGSPDLEREYTLIENRVQFGIRMYLL